MITRRGRPALEARPRQDGGTGSKGNSNRRAFGSLSVAERVDPRTPVGVQVARAPRPPDSEGIYECGRGATYQSTVSRSPATITRSVADEPVGGGAITLLRSKEPPLDTTRTESWRTPNGIVIERESVPV